MKKEKLLQRQQVMDWLQVKSSATIYRLIDKQGLPRPLKLSPGKSGRAFWRKHEIQHWLDRRQEGAQ